MDERKLTKGELRKLNALRKSLGDEIAEKAFAEWYEKFGSSPEAESDKNAATIAETLKPLVKSNKLQIPRGGYLLRRGRGRVIVEHPEPLSSGRPLRRAATKAHEHRRRSPPLSRRRKD
jgi:hypothetical protein